MCRPTRARAPGPASIAKQLCGVDIDDFFERYVRGTADLPLAQMLADVGVRMHLRPATGAQDKGGKPAGGSTPTAPWLGATLKKSGTRSVFGTVIAGSPAERAGLSPGDEAVAIDELKLTSGNLARRLAERHAGDEVTLSVFRGDQLMRLRATLSDAPEDTCYLVIDPEASDAAGEKRRAWLSG